MEPSPQTVELEDMKLLNEPSQDGSNVLLDTEEGLELPEILDARASNAIAAFNTCTMCTVLRIPAAHLTDLLKKGSAGRKLGKKKSTSNIKKEAETTYVYVCGFATAAGVTDIELPIINYELYRTKSSPFLHFRASSKVTPLPVSEEYELRLIEMIRIGSIMTATILDNEGQIVQSEKFTIDFDLAEHNMRFEIEEFVSMAALADILSANGGINISVDFVCSRIFPVPNSAESAKLRENACRPLPTTKVPAGFKGFLIHDGIRFNSQIGTRILNDSLCDGTIKVLYEDNDEVRIPIHRVFLAAQSPVLETLFREPKAEVSVEGFEVTVVRAFLDYIYSGEVYDDDMSLLANLAKLADKFEVPSLRERCVRNILLTFARERKVSKQVSIDYFRLGKQLKVPQFTQIALDQYKKSKTKAGKKPRVRNVKLKVSNSSIICEESRVLQSLEKLNCAPLRVEEVIKICKSKERPIDCTTGMCMVMSAGFLYKLSAESLDKLLEAPLQSGFDDKGEQTYVEYDMSFSIDMDIPGLDKVCILTGRLRLFKTRDSDDINLRIVELPLESDDDEIIDVVPLKCLICRLSGRCIHEAHCTSFKRREDSRKVWEIIPFIPTREFSKFKVPDEHQEVVIFTSMTCRNRSNCHAPIILKDSPSNKATAAEELVLDAMLSNDFIMDSFSARLHAQFRKCASFTDAAIHMIDQDEKIVTTFPVHRVIVSAFSELMEKAFKQNPPLGLHVPVKHFSVDAMEAMLHYVYGMHIPLMTLELGLQLLNVCKDFTMGPRFKEYIIYHLLNIKDWTFEFCLIFYQYGHFRNAYTMKEAAIQGFKKNKAEFQAIPEFQRFVKTFPELGERLADKKKLAKELELATGKAEALLDKLSEPQYNIDEDVESVRTELTEILTRKFMENPGSLSQNEAMKSALEELVCKRDNRKLASLPKITPEMRVVINGVRTGSDFDRFQYSSGEISRNDLKSLSYGTFLTDKIINEYFALINWRETRSGVANAGAFSGVCYRDLERGRQVSLLTDRLDLLEVEYLLFPAKIGTHWILIAALPKRREIKCYDSLGKNREASIQLIQKFLVFEEKRRNKNRSKCNCLKWTTEMVSSIPEQTNSWDCGVFVCKYAEYLSAGKRLIFNSSHIDYFRDIMTWDIVQQKLTADLPVVTI